MNNKIIVTFIVDDASKNTTPNPLNFGQMFWSPEVSCETNRSNQGAPITALSVNPRYRHVVNLPVLAEFNVSGLNKVLGKVVSKRQAV